MKKIKVGVTHGDFNSISYELILKCFNDKRMLDLVTPVVYGSSKVLSYYRKTLKMTDVDYHIIKAPEFAKANKPNLINIYENEVKIEMGKVDKKAGELAFMALEQAIKDLKNGKIDVLVTAPINKTSIHSEQFHYPGHTEYLTDKLGGGDDMLMLMVNENLRVAIFSGHVPLSEVFSHVTKENLIKKLSLFNRSLEQDFGIHKPKIAVLGLNPHSGDNGLIGDEELHIINPAISEANEQGITTFGPFPADGFFGSTKYREFDGIMALYHDQGMLPFKVMAFDSGVNYTAGLPFVRTSPAHGTAFDIVGRGMASVDSFRQAVYTAVDIFRNRSEFAELTSNPLPEEENDKNNRNYQPDNSSKA